MKADQNFKKWQISSVILLLDMYYDPKESKHAGTIQGHGVGVLDPHMRAVCLVPILLVLTLT